MIDSEENFNKNLKLSFKNKFLLIEFVCSFLRSVVAVKVMER